MSSRINMENFEAFLLDHAEGNLSAEDTQELKTFLLLHPELDIDLDDLELPTLELTKTVFSDKDTLKKTHEFSEEDVVAYLEGQLSDTKRLAFETELAANASLRNELELYRKTKLIPENEIVFADRSFLKRTEEDLVTGDPVLLYMEGVMTTSESAAFEQELSNDQQLSAELKAFRKTKLAADTTVVYPNKEELKKETRVFYLFSSRKVVAYAASILLIVGVFVLFRSFNEQIQTPQGLADNNGKTAIQLNEQAVSVVTVQLAGSNDPVNTVKETALLAKNAIRNVTTKENGAISAPTPTTVINTPSLATSDTLNKLAVVENTLSIPSGPNDRVEHAPVVESNTMQKQVLLAYEEDTDDDGVKQKRSGFWKRAVAVARQANNMGLKAVNGKEEVKENYMISFNSFSVEKK